MKIIQMALVLDHHHQFKPFKQRCKLQSFTQADFSLLEFDPTKLAHSLKQAVAVANIHRSTSSPCLPLVKDDTTNTTTPKVEIVGGGHAPGVLGLVVETAISMACGIEPVQVKSSLGGAYYLRNLNGTNIALVKPIDEEPLAFDRILGHPGLKHSVRVGETAVREVAAYLLDHNGFAGVPPTALVKISNVTFHANPTNSSMETTPPPPLPLPKIASIQRFVDHDFDAGDLGSSGFSVASVHRIGILDIRLLNLDRHAGNILVKKHKCDGYATQNYAVLGAGELVPIDHGLCLPEILDDPYFEWLHWPQAALPFSESEADYICRLNPVKDAEILRTELPSLTESCIRILALCTVFLKHAVVAGLCLADVGDMMTREYCGTKLGPSVLEILCAKVIEYMNSVSEEDEEEDNQIKEQNEQDSDVFQFDIECEESCTDVFNELPRLLQSQSHYNASKPPKIPIKVPAIRRTVSEFPQGALSPLHEDDDNEDTNVFDEHEEDGSSNDHKIGTLTRSVSFPAGKHKNEIGNISFRDMSEEEWGLFLENFEKELPKAFEDRKKKGLKQRLGTSCKF